MRACIWPKRAGARATLFTEATTSQHRIENFFARLKLFRRVSNRYDKLALTFLAAALD
jgi:transposase